MSGARSYVKRLWRGLAGRPHTGAHMTRYSMYARLSGIVPRDTANSVLSVSRSVPLVTALGLNAARVTAADFPAHDLRALTEFEDDSFDVVVSDQVLEHIEGSPDQAVRESVRVARPGGHVVHTSCLMNPVHEAPADFWRFTPQALELLCREAGAEVVESGGWGNRIATFAMEIGWREVPVPRARWHPLHRIATRNDPRWPISTWVVARKPASSDEATDE